MERFIWQSNCLKPKAMANQKISQESLKREPVLIEEEERCEEGFIKSMVTNLWQPSYGSLLFVHIAKILFGDSANRAISVKVIADQQIFI